MLSKLETQALLEQSLDFVMMTATSMDMAGLPENAKDSNRSMILERETGVVLKYNTSVTEHGKLSNITIFGTLVAQATSVPIMLSKKLH
jgi:hypothetical protein